MKLKKKYLSNISSVTALVVSIFAIAIAYKSCAISEESLRFSQKKYYGERALFLKAEFKSGEIQLIPINKNIQIMGGMVYLPSELSLSFYFNYPNIRFLDHLLKGNLQYFLEKKLNVPIDSITIGQNDLPLIIKTNYIAGGDLYTDISVYYLKYDMFLYKSTELKSSKIIFLSLNFNKRLPIDKKFSYYINVVDNLWKVESDFKTFSDSSTYFGNKSSELNYANRFEEALVYAEKSIILNNFSGSAWSNKAYALQQLGRYEEALDSYNKAIANNPKLVVVWSNKALSLTEMGRNEEALASVNQAIKLDSNYTYAWNNRAHVQLILNRNEEALFSAKKALSLDSSYVLNWIRVGDCFLSLNKRKKAIIYFRRAVSIDSMYSNIIDIPNFE